MKVEFNKDGVLVISAENHTERVALSIWFDCHNMEDPKDLRASSVLCVDIDSYCAKKEKAPALTGGSVGIFEEQRQ